MPHDTSQGCSVIITPHHLRGVVEKVLCCPTRDWYWRCNKVQILSLQFICPPNDFNNKTLPATGRTPRAILNAYSTTSQRSGLSAAPHCNVQEWEKVGWWKIIFQHIVLNNNKQLPPNPRSVPTWCQCGNEYRDTTKGVCGCKVKTCGAWSCEFYKFVFVVMVMCWGDSVLCISVGMGCDHNAWGESTRGWCEEKLVENVAFCSKCTLGTFSCHPHWVSYVPINNTDNI